jgi:predicted neutral ceramidase superfamily lipid hydrolase
MLADILSGELDLADAVFLVAFILAVVAAVFYAVAQPHIARWAPVAVALAVAGIAFGLMAL